MKIPSIRDWRHIPFVIWLLLLTELLNFPRGRIANARGKPHECLSPWKKAVGGNIPRKSRHHRKSWRISCENRQTVGLIDSYKLLRGTGERGLLSRKTVTQWPLSMAIGNRKNSCSRGEVCLHPKAEKKGKGRKKGVVRSRILIRSVIRRSLRHVRDSESMFTSHYEQQS